MGVTEIPFSKKMRSISRSKIFLCESLAFLRLKSAVVWSLVISEL